MDRSLLTTHHSPLKMYSAIDHFTDQCVRLSNEERAFFHSLLLPRTVGKKTFLLRKGEVCNFEAYLVKGCIRTFYIDENGFEINLQFAVEDWWVSDIASFTERKPSGLFIQTLEACELLVIDHDRKEQLFHTYPKFERMFRLMLQRNLSVLQHRFLATVSQPAEQRYLEFIQRYPDIQQRVPQHMIASYLGISAEFLSKIRKRRK